MKNSILIILLICILQSVLFYGKNLGINVLIFIVPLLIFLVLTLKSHNKIKNKWGLSLIIPILILSANYLIYDNAFLKSMNLIIIPTLIILMYIFTINPTNKITSAIKDGFRLVFEPFGCIGKFFNLVSMKLDKIFKLSKESKKKLGSFLIILPIIIIILILLSKADMMFNNLMKNVFKIFENITIGEIIGRLILIFILFTYLGAVINYLLFSYKENNNNKEHKKIISSYTTKVLLTTLNIIYIIFTVIQIKSLLLQQLTNDINYAEYARSGFFQLMVISIINICILLISKHNKDEDHTKYNNIMGIITIILTLVIIASSFARMYMYETAYGYTTLRLLVYWILITEIVLLIPTVFYILNNKTNILKYYLIVIITSYAILNIVPIDYSIAKNNINRYNNSKKLDIDYLKNNHADNLPLLVDLYNKTNDEKIKNNLECYLITAKGEVKTNDFQELNISKKIAYEKVKDIKGNERFCYYYDYDKEYEEYTKDEYIDDNYIEDEYIID